MTILLQNLTVKRLWPQVNSRVNYPIKQILVKMEEDEMIDISDPVTLFCVSFITINMSAIGMERFVAT